MSVLKFILLIFILTADVVLYRRQWCFNKTQHASTHITQNYKKMKDTLRIVNKLQTELINITINTLTFKKKLNILYTK
jgi:hypothetical protein